MIKPRTSVAPAHYLVCDRCGFLWDIEAGGPDLGEFVFGRGDPTVCAAGQSEELWRFSRLEPARAHAGLVRDRRNP